MKKSIYSFVAVLGLALASSPAFATKPGNNGGGNGGCGNGQQTNGCGAPTGSNTATGGAGGHGTGVGIGVGVGVGQGGNGYGGAGGRGGDGGSVIGSGNSSNVNSNKQAQGQKQGQSQSSRNDNRSSANATGGSNSNSNANSGNNSDQSVTVQGDSYDAPRIPVATAYAPNIAPTAVCMGASSAGGSGASISLSFGTSWTDENCMKLEQARTLAGVLNDQATAAELLCDIPAIAAARSRVGKPCAGDVKTVQAAPQQAAAVAPQSMGDNHQPKYTPAPAQTPIVVSQVPPRVERFRVTTAGLVPAN